MKSECFEEGKHFLFILFSAYLFEDHMTLCVFSSHTSFLPKS